MILLGNQPFSDIEALLELSTTCKQYFQLLSSFDALWKTSFECQFLSVNCPNLTAEERVLAEVVTGHKYHYPNIIVVSFSFSFFTSRFFDNFD